MTKRLSLGPAYVADNATNASLWAGQPRAFNPRTADVAIVTRRAGFPPIGLSAVAFAIGACAVMLGVAVASYTPAGFDLVATFSGEAVVIDTGLSAEDCERLPSFAYRTVNGDVGMAGETIPHDWQYLTVATCERPS